MTELQRLSQPSGPWSRIRGLLDDYGFSRPSDLPSAFRRLKTKDLDSFLDQYRAIFLDKDGNVLIGETSPGVAVWPDHITTTDWVEKLRAWALWVDRVYVSDPVLAVTGPSARDTRFTLGESPPLDVKVQHAVEQLLRMFPFVETDYANLTGVPLFREAPAVPPLTLDPASDRFDPQLREIALRRLRVAPGRKPQGKGVVSYLESDFGPVLGEARSSDILLFAFEEDADVRVADGFFWATIATISDDGRISGRIPMSGAPIPKEAFEPWLNQSVVKVLRRRFRELAQEAAWKALGRPEILARKAGSELAQASWLGRHPWLAGLVLPGEFQFNVVIPESLGDGDQPITATYGEGSTQPGTLITIHK